MISMNVYNGETGAFVYTGKYDENIARTELEKGNAVEIFDNERNEPVSNARSYSIRTDEDGFASLV
jgi:hypothetical protein